MVHGHAGRQFFSVPKVGSVGGCYVTNGRSHVLIRSDCFAKEYHLGREALLYADLKMMSRVSHGYECGMNLDGFNDIKKE